VRELSNLNGNRGRHSSSGRRLRDWRQKKETTNPAHLSDRER
jgi:hypothetical protein